MSNLGEKVTFDNMAYPGSQPPDDLFSSAEETEAPFSMEAPKAKTKGFDSAYDPKAPKVKEAPKPVASLESPEIKKAPSLQLQKFREAFGLQRIKKTPVTLVRGEGESKVSMTFHVRAMNYEDYQWALVKSAEMDNVPIMFAWNMAKIAISVCAMDMELEEGQQPTPIHDVFALTVESPSQVKDPYYPASSLRFAAAEAFWNELRGSLFDVVEELSNAVEEKIEDQKQAAAKERQENPLV